MKIVMVTPSIPHPFASTAAKWYYMLLRGLAKRGYQIICLSYSEEKPSIVAEAKDLITKFHSNFFYFPQEVDTFSLRRKVGNLIKPYSEVLQQNKLKKTLLEHLEDADVLHLEQLVTGWLQTYFTRSLINIHYFESIDWGQRDDLTCAEKKMFFQSKRAAKKIIRQANFVGALTPRLEKVILDINPHAKTWVTPFAIDVENYEVLPKNLHPTIGLIGSMHWYPSRSAALRLLTKIWPLIKKELPQARLIIAGWNAKKYFNQYMSLPDVSIEDNIPHPKDFFSKISTMIYIPSRGSGIKVKILEAMAYGIPVVTNEEGTEGINCHNREDLIVSEDDTEIAHSAVELLTNSQLHSRIKINARTLIESDHSEKAAIPRIEKIYQDMLGTDKECKQ